MIAPYRRLALWYGSLTVLEAIFVTAMLAMLFGVLFTVLLGPALLDLLQTASR